MTDITELVAAFPKELNSEATSRYLVKAGPHSIGHGVQVEYKFPNGYGASVIRFATEYGGGSYGAQDGFFELAVLGPDGRLTYSTPITDDVLGWLSAQEVDAVLLRIKNLPAA